MAPVLTVFDSAFDTKFFSGAANTSSSVPGRWDVALDGIGFVLDSIDEKRRIHHQTIPTIRRFLGAQTLEPDELTLNPEGLWRRSQSSWHLGAGQAAFDHPSNSPWRFRASKGLDPLSARTKLTLLPDTALVKAGNTAAGCVVAGSNLYFDDGTNLWTTTDLAASTQVTGTPVAAPVGLVSTGSYVASVWGASGIYMTAAGNTTAVSWITGTVTAAAYVKGRFMCTNGQSVYNITAAFNAAASALPTALFTHPDASFVFNSFAEGVDYIFMGGNSNNRAMIYKTSIKADGSSLDVPTVAGQLPDGEKITALYGYLGNVFIGTNRGVRVAVANSAGNLSIGSLIDLGVAVNAFYGRSYFVFFGWTNYDTVSTGIGRLDPSQLTNAGVQTYAYASDLMITGQGAVTGIAFFNSLYVLAATGPGVYKQSANLVPTGTLQTGLIHFGVPEDKVITGAQVLYTGNGSITTQVAPNGGAFQTVLQSGSQIRGQQVELQLTVNRSGTDATQGPTILHSTLLGYPAPTPSMLIRAAVMLRDDATRTGGAEDWLDVSTIYQRIRDLWTTKRLTVWQEGNTQYDVIVMDFSREQREPSPQNPGLYEGKLILEMKVL